ncbi:hypothetical protein D9M68_817880 [compost metagenome]
MVLQAEESTFGNRHHFVGDIPLEKPHVDYRDRGFVEPLVFTADERTTHSVLRAMRQTCVRRSILHNCLSVNDTHALDSPKLWQFKGRIAVPVDTIHH